MLANQTGQEKNSQQMEHDPRKRKNFSLGLHHVTCRNFGPSSDQAEKELKMLGDNNKNAIWAPLPSFLPALITTFQ